MKNILRLILLFPTFLFAQTATPPRHILDSLKNELLTIKNDTTRCHILSLLALHASDSETVRYNTELINFTEQKLKNIGAQDPNKRFYLIKSALAKNNAGYFANQTGNAMAALNYYKEALAIRQQIDDKSGIAFSTGCMAEIYGSFGDVPKALDNYSYSLKILESIADTMGIAYTLNNIGFIYQSQGDLDKAFEYFTRCLKLHEAIKNNRGIATALNNVGSIYHKRKNISMAVEYYTKSLSLKESMGDIGGVIICYNNIGMAYKQSGDIKKALEYYGKGFSLAQKSGNKKLMSTALNNMGVLSFQSQQYKQAYEYATNAYNYAEETGMIENSRNSSSTLYKIYKQRGDYKNAIFYYEKFIKLRDSISNTVTKKASIKFELKYEYEKQAAADSVAHAKESEIKNVQLQKQTAEIKAKKNQQYALFGGLGLVIIFAGFMYNRFKITQKQKFVIEEQKLIVEEQKKIVEEKQKEVLDSIHYAKRIQTALIPSDKYIEKSLNKLQKRG